MRFYYRDSAREKWVVRSSGAESVPTEQDYEPAEDCVRIEPPPNDNPQWYIAKDTYQWRQDPVPFLKMIRQGFWPLPPAGIPPIPYGGLSAALVSWGDWSGALSLGIFGMTAGISIGLMFVVYAISKERCTNEPAYVEIGGFLIGFVTITGTSALIAIL